MKGKPRFYTIALLTIILAACASPAPIAAPTSTATATAAPIPTATQTSTPTATATATATAIPATPEYESELRYNPETRALTNLQGTPVFILLEDGSWESLVEAKEVEPVFSMELVGRVEYEGGVLEIPLGIGLMQDLAEREVEPITGFSVNPERPDAADRLAWYFLRQCYHNHTQNFEADAGMSFEEYLKEVAEGRGLIRVVVADPEVSSWDSPARPSLEIVELSPLGGLTVYKSDEIFGLDGIYGFYVTENNGGLVIVGPEGSSEGYASQPDVVARQVGFSSTYLRLISNVLGVDMDEVVESGYLGPNSYVDYDESVFQKELEEFFKDYVNFTDISQSKPHFEIEQ